MRYNDANCGRSHRWIDGQGGLLAWRVTSYVAFDHDMSFGLLPKEASSTV
jgi:hypothetical protein